MTSFEYEPLVSVIVPIYNVEARLERALRCLCGQSYRNLQIICVNDGSTDGSLSIVQRFADRDSRIVVIDKPNAGYGAACNDGLDAATGTWAAIFEPDDFAAITMYEHLVSFGSCFGPDVDVVKAPYWRVIDAGTRDERLLNCSFRGRVPHCDRPVTIDQAPHLLRHHPSIWSAIYRTEFLKSHGIRFVEAPGAGWTDNPFLYETLCQARSIAYLDIPLYCYEEDDAETAEAFYAKQPLVPLARMRDINEVLKATGETREEVLLAYVARGFNYAEHIVGAGGLEKDEVIEGLLLLFTSMDPDLVARERTVSPAMRALYEQFCGPLPETAIEPLSYQRYLVEEGIYTLGNTGLVNTAKSLITRI